MVTNAVVLWNTIYTQPSLNHLRGLSFEAREKDEARLSPLIYGHINMLGLPLYFGEEDQERRAQATKQPFGTRGNNLLAYVFVPLGFKPRL